MASSSEHVPHTQDHEHDHPHPLIPQDGWKTEGVRVIPADSLDGNTPQTPGMDRKAAINFARVGAQKIWVRHLWTCRWKGLNILTHSFRREQSTFTQTPKQEYAYYPCQAFLVVKLTRGKRPTTTAT